MKKLLLIIILSSAALLAQEQESSLNKQMNTQLLQPITVTVGGDFVVTGSFTAYRSQRVDHFITILFTQAKEKITSSLNQLETIKQVYQGLDRFPLRDITLKRVSGEILKVDLLKFRLTGDFKYNPYLMNDDVIIFSAYDDERNFIDIDGAVNKPVKFQFVEGDKLSDAIMFAGGLNLAYDNVKFVEISRLKEKGEKEELLVSSISDDVILKRGDRIRVMFDENEKRVFKVLVLGEVQKPGYVYITKNSTTIKEVVEKVGGFTANASLGKSELIRGTSDLQLLKMKAFKETYEKEGNITLTQKFYEKTFNEMMTEQLLMLRTADISVEDTAYFYVDNALRVFQNQSIVDFTKINSDSTSDSKYIVRNGDVIVVPYREELVYLFGQVYTPGFVKYEKGKDWKFYLNKSGGKTELADSDVKIIKAKTRTWITADSDVRIEPGDFIYVPKDIPKRFDWYLKQVGSLSSIITAVATIVLIIVQSGK